MDRNSGGHWHLTLAVVFVDPQLSYMCALRSIHPPSMYPSIHPPHPTPPHPTPPHPTPPHPTPPHPTPPTHHSGCKGWFPTVSRYNPTRNIPVSRRPPFICLFMFQTIQGSANKKGSQILPYPSISDSKAPSAGWSGSLWTLRAGRLAQRQSISTLTTPASLGPRRRKARKRRVNHPHGFQVTGMCLGFYF